MVFKTNRMMTLIGKYYYADRSCGYLAKILKVILCKFSYKDRIEKAEAYVGGKELGMAKRREEDITRRFNYIKVDERNLFLYDQTKLDPCAY